MGQVVSPAALSPAQPRASLGRAKSGPTSTANNLNTMSCAVAAPHSIQSTFLSGPHQTVQQPWEGRGDPVKIRDREAGGGPGSAVGKWWGGEQSPHLRTPERAGQVAGGRASMTPAARQ